MARYDDADDDDRPRKSRRPRDDDEDDDRPRARRSRKDEDEDDDRPQIRRRPLDDADEDRPRRKKRKARPPVKQMSPVGMGALAIGVFGLVVSFMPCFASYALIPAGIGLVVGFVGLILAHKSDGRQGIGMPLAGMSVSAVAVVIAVGWLVLGKQIEKKIDRELKQADAQAAKDEAAHQKELAKAADDVKAAAQGGAKAVTAVQFSQDYDADDRAADRTYKNKVLDISGAIEEVQIDEQADTYAVVLKGGPNDSVECEFAKSPDVRARLAALRPGQWVTIRGKCLGGAATIEACVLVE